MKITKKDANLILNNTEGWLLAVENLCGSLHWNGINGEILWIGNAEDCSLNAPNHFKSIQHRIHSS